MNINIRYGQMTMALLAQAAIHQLRERLSEPYCKWDATHLAKDLFHRLEGDVRVTDDTIVVTYYNAQEELRSHYEDLPEKLSQKRASIRPFRGSTITDWISDFADNPRYPPAREEGQINRPQKKAGYASANWQKATFFS